jgi:nuclear inhibitor of protein phosphatase 1
MEEGEGALLGLPETEGALDNLTEFNTAHNRRIAAIGDIPDVPRNRKRRSNHVNFNDEEQIINPGMF